MDNFYINQERRKGLGPRPRRPAAPVGQGQVRLWDEPEPKKVVVTKAPKTRRPKREPTVQIVGGVRIIDID